MWVLDGNVPLCIWWEVKKSPCKSAAGCCTRMRDGPLCTGQFTATFLALSLCQKNECDSSTCLKPHYIKAATAKKRPRLVRLRVRELHQGQGGVKQNGSGFLFSSTLITRKAPWGLRVGSSYRIEKLLWHPNYPLPRASWLF